MNVLEEGKNRDINIILSFISNFIVFLIKRSSDHMGR